MKLDDEQSADLFRLLCGELIGEGQFRKVFACNIMPDCVVKIDTRSNWSNVGEMEMWDELRGSPLARWLAPVEWLSAGGIWLIQKRTQPIKAEQLPRRIPDIFADLKPENWGLLKGRPVCHDYGNHNAYTVAKRRARLRAVRWRL